MKTAEVITILEENKITNVQPTQKCKETSVRRTQSLKIPRIIFTVMSAINYTASHGNTTGAIQIPRGILIKNKLRHLDLFSGIGGFSVGMEDTQRIETVAFCEIDGFCKKILNKHWPTVPVYNDIKELTYDKLKADGIISKDKKIDILTGGYPCQPFSVAGAKKGDKDPRHLWPEMFRIIKEIRPDWIVAENVSGHIKLGLDTVLQDLEDQNYSARTFSLSASSVGANHKRERVWIVANANSGGNNKKKSRRIGKENEKEIGNRKNDGSTGIAEGADNAVTQQGSVAKMEHVEDARRRSWGEQSSRNKESARRGTFETAEWSTNANTIAGSGKRATTVANTHSDREKRNQPQDGKGSWSKQGSSNMADTESIGSHGGEHENNQQETGNKKSRGKLEESVAMWPTTTNRMYKLPRLPETMKKTKRNPLTNTIEDAVQHREGKSWKETGSLNPTWCEWLMGYPTGHTDLKR